MSGPTVVVVGDSFSLGEPSDTWVGTAAEELGWGLVTNLSSPGRGYITAPRSCDFAPCDTFIGTISAIAEAQPDIVVTFGGTADGDYSLADPAAEYFEALRAALPQAELVAISPITTEDPAPFFLTLHNDTIRDGVEAVDGTFVDVGQPGVGDGETLSGDAQAEIAQQVVDQLK
ncbi:SGNH/GDSL hydrolase family protein [Tessaracoccus sp. MC1627]|uniref:SGNH/GDSL hydrolase family protein n=1 Tax=Tessaracoccus sp. MC1627 TaxID=2760312 RepID=UPI0016049FE2|nr:SGNH/GDSL hydrolase family protein [Tessaracoccus sp. MC1627]MBB1512574.1 SGNH/GDSL hydrolase family protein [Tessaracoccus sp. MC1627]